MTFKCTNIKNYNTEDKCARRVANDNYIEIVEKYGIDVYYIVKENLQESVFINGWEDGIFQISQSMKLLKESIVEFGNNDMFSKFGFNSADNLTFYGAISVFNDYNIKPKRGDLIYCPTIGNKVFEITHADRETPNNKYVFGKEPMAYSLQSSLYKMDQFYDYSNSTPISQLNIINTKEIDKKNNKQKDQILQNNIISSNSKKDPLLD